MTRNVLLVMQISFLNIKQSMIIAFLFPPIICPQFMLFCAYESISFQEVHSNVQLADLFLFKNSNWQIN